MLVVGLFMLAALVGSFIPRNGDWEEAQDGVTIYLHDNGIHTSIIIPCGTKSAVYDIYGDKRDYRCIFSTDDLPVSNFPTRYQMIGWGDREFYLNTPKWNDLDLGTAATALRGSGRTLVHVDHLIDLPKKRLKAVKVSNEAYVEIVLQVLSEAQIEVNTIYYTLKPIKGYGKQDVFYSGINSSVDGYSAVNTCNNWVSDVLAKAGVKTGYWTPLPFGVMWWY
jgi:uncharacterized protein (TIGR02117 family)